ncbi:hypothetical protein DFH09DRAFT_931217 [Mycena vulgaris]|nr:hypothetical protein DFH09DRAFT_931217 [Mycena vulgaris]
MAVFHHYQPTAFELDNNTHTAPIASGSGHRASPEPSGSRQAVTPLRRQRDPNIDPALYTPSKRMRFMTGALAGTESGSFLVSKTAVTSRSTIAPPVLEKLPPLPGLDWGLIDANRPNKIQHLSANDLRGRVEELTSSLMLGRQHLVARDGIIEAANAQLIIQNIFVSKQSEALHGKENKKRKGKGKVKVFDDGKGRHLTAPQFIEALEKETQEKADEEAAKDSRAKARENKKAARAALEKEWKKIKAAHQVAVERWEGQCATLKAAGVRGKSLPKKPKRAKKPELPKATSENDDDDDDSDDSDSD